MNESTRESINSLTERDAKACLHLIYEILSASKTGSPNEQLVSHALFVYEHKIPKIVNARKNRA